MSYDYDTIVIGSGIGGLTCASLLSQLGRERVLVLERHFKFGGFTHTFKRQGYEWDVGLHYVGEMHKGSMLRAIFDFITGGGVQWNKMPEVYDRFHFPDFTFAFRSGTEALREDLKKSFPGEKSAVDPYFKDVAKAAGWITRHSLSKVLPGAWNSRLRRILPFWNRNLALSTTGEYLDAHFKSPRLKALLAGQWGDYGLGGAGSPMHGDCWRAAEQKGVPGPPGDLGRRSVCHLP